MTQRGALALVGLLLAASLPGPVHGAYAEDAGSAPSLSRVQRPLAPPPEDVLRPSTLRLLQPAAEARAESAPPPARSAASSAPRAQTAAPAIAPPPAPAAGPEQLVLQGVNAQRAAHGLPLFKADGRLAQVAAERSRDMAARGYFSHQTPEGLWVWDILAARGISAPYVGENLGRNGDPATLVGMWMESPAHRKNVLAAHFTRVGISFQSGILTAVFAGP